MSVTFHQFQIEPEIFGCINTYPLGEIEKEVVTRILLFVLVESSTQFITATEEFSRSKAWNIDFFLSTHRITTSLFFAGHVDRFIDFAIFCSEKDSFDVSHQFVGVPSMWSFGTKSMQE